ncbi:hypothetical protein RHMOL_Rhmol08G0037500 [Rhododendron molle]|uniref:Uncharacterized protein n=1 Tax=Rhododendron molle TaxID=49168 RepID=A0ACC0MJF2_RHOML|nr:hypothetical protein RHMOL_Rhmol08G0037500 [Rhododendron molle]
MAAAADHHPRDPSTAALNSPKSNRGAAARGVPSPPWTTRVRNSESESDSIVSSSSYAASPSSPYARGQTGHSTSNPSPSKEEEAAAVSSTSSFSAGDEAGAGARSESCDNNGAGAESGSAGKKPVWNKPSNGAVEVGGAVMGAVSWPALSESTHKASPKPSNPSDSLKPLPEGSGSGIASSSQKQVVTNDTNPSLGPNHVAPTRQKSMKRSGGSSGVTANGGFHGPVEPLGQVAEIPFDIAGLPGLSVPETSPRDHMQKGSGQRGGFGSQSRSGNDHSQQRSSYRRGNGTPNPRSDGSYHQNHGGRDRVNHDRNSHRSFNGRDSQMQPQRVVPPRGFMQHPQHGSTPFFPPPPMPVRPFGNPFYAEVAPPMFYVPVPPPPSDSLRGVPIVTPLPPPALLFPPPDPLLHAKIVTQINYYFSNENLISDTFLRRNMDEDGWVPIKLIAGFKKVMVLTNDIPLILDALRSSDVVEVQNGKVRKRNDWRRWIMPPSIEFHTVSSPRSVERSSHETHDMLTANIQSMSVGEQTNKQARAETFLSRSYSGDLNSTFQLSTAEGTHQAPIQAGTELSNFS